MSDLIKDGVFINTVVEILTVKDGFRNIASLTWFHIYMSPLRTNWTLIVLSVWKLLCYQSASPVEVTLRRTTVNSAKGRVHCRGSTTSASRVVRGTTATLGHRALLTVDASCNILFFKVSLHVHVFVLLFRFQEVSIKGLLFLECYNFLWKFMLSCPQKVMFNCMRKVIEEK